MQSRGVARWFKFGLQMLFQKPFANVRNLLIDLGPETLLRAAQTSVRDLAGYNLLAPEAEKELNIKVHQINPLEYFTVGQYSVMAFPANHAAGMGAMLCSVEENARALFYGTDTATLHEDT